LFWQYSPCWLRVLPKQQHIIDIRDITLRGIIIEAVTGVRTGVTDIPIVAATTIDGVIGIATKAEG